MMLGPIPRHKLLLLTFVFYAAMIALALVWSWHTDRSLWAFDISKYKSWIFVENIILGTMFAIFVHVMTRGMSGRFQWSDDLMEWFESELGHITISDALFLAILSGFGEELLFRGAMQPNWGLVLTSIMFALMHLPPQKKLMAWTWMAGLIGLILGIMVELRGSLVPVVVGHVGVNFLNLSYLSRRAQTRRPA